MVDLHTFDWVGRSDPAPETIPTRLSMMTLAERNQRMLENLGSACISCTMCELGMDTAKRGGIERDPHVFSNYNASKFFVVGQNPGWDELSKGEPFVGAAGKNFDSEIRKHGLTRSDFYICNTIRCFTTGNVKPTDEHRARCEPYLQMEINILRPQLIVALGAVAFGQLCPGASFGESLKKLVKSKYGVPVFAIYHPSPLNFREAARREQFNEQIRVMCGVVSGLKARLKAAAVQD